jgi:predicted transposase YbfD/YdcC
VDLAGRVVTGDAQFCQRALSAQVIAAGGSYLWTVKENQPCLLNDLATLFASPPPGTTVRHARSVTRHGNREEVRLLRTSTALAGEQIWPHLGLACVVQRVVTCRGKTTYDESYAVGSTALAAVPTATMLALWRSHWGIETRLHWLRDVTLDEDRCQVRTGSGPQALAAVRNTVIGVLRLAGKANIAAALRTCAGKPADALRLLGLL